MLYIGIDLGTSSVKLLLTDETGKKYASVTKKYDVEYPKPGWSQQNPEDWYNASMCGIEELIKGYDKSLIAGIGIAGQMHGLVLLDDTDSVIRPAILWNDGRTEAEVTYLNDIIGKSKISAETANIAFAGFTAPKLLWLKKYEPENYKRINKIMLPKDYLVYRITGNHATDFSDASGTLLLDVKNRCWSREMCKICGVNETWLPTLYDSAEIVGNVKNEITGILGIREIPVVAGAGDNAAAAIGTGTINNGDCNISLGTSGTIFIASDKFCLDEKNSLHSFAYVRGKYHLMGCILSAASCVDWWMSILNTTDYSKFAEMKNKLGHNSVFFLPYLMGERSPLNDVDARGAFIGMSATTTRHDMSLAVLEGVGFALRDSLEIARKLNVYVNESMCCGGGSRIEIWTQIISNILNVTINLPELEEGPSLGAAILAMVACGEYDSIETACGKIVKVKKQIVPEPELVALYNERYALFRKLYPALKHHYCEAASL